jgi:HKD family nuclease
MVPWGNKPQGVLIMNTFFAMLIGSLLLTQAAFMLRVEWEHRKGRNDAGTRTN